MLAIYLFSMLVLISHGPNYYSKMMLGDCGKWWNTTYSINPSTPANTRYGLLEEADDLAS